MKKMKKLPKNVLFLGLVSLFNDISSEMIYPLIPLFLTSVLKAPVGILGIIEGIAEATASLVKVFSGFLSDKLGKRKLLTVLGYSLSSFSKPILALATKPYHVLLVRFSDRFGKGIRTAPRDALIAQSAGKMGLGRIFGFHRALDTFGASIGPLIAFWLLKNTNNNFRLVFLASFIASIIALSFLILKVKENKKKKIQEEKFVFNLKKLPTVFYLFVCSMTIFTLGNSSTAFLLLKARQVGIGIAFIPIVYFLFNITYALLSYPMGILADKIGKRKTIVFGLLTFALVYLGFAKAQTPWLVIILFIFYGFYSAQTEGVQRAYLAGVVEKKYLGTAYGILNTTTGLALLPASIIGGLLWQYYGSAYTFLYGSIMAILAIGIFMITYLNEQNG